METEASERSGHFRGSTEVLKQGEIYRDAQEHAVTASTYHALSIQIGKTTQAIKPNARHKIRLETVNFYYGTKKVLSTITLPIHEHHITALIGPSGCGKTTALRTMNRMHDHISGARLEGSVFLDGEDISDPLLDVVQVRQRVGMVFQRPNPFPFSIFENIAYGLRAQRWSRRRIGEAVETSLREAALWEEVKDRLHQSAQGLSGGQQQRLCIARALAIKPEVLLMDEPCSALDPIATMNIEELIIRLREEYTIVMVTHNMQQAARVSQYTGFFLTGNLIEFGKTSQLFLSPRFQETKDYISGRFG